MPTDNKKSTFGFLTLFQSCLSPGFEIHNTDPDENKEKSMTFRERADYFIEQVQCENWHLKAIDMQGAETEIQKSPAFNKNCATLINLFNSAIVKCGNNEKIKNNLLDAFKDAYKALCSIYADPTLEDRDLATKFESVKQNIMTGISQLYSYKKPDIKQTDINKLFETIERAKLELEILVKQKITLKAAYNIQTRVNEVQTRIDASNSDLNPKDFAAIKGSLNDLMADPKFYENPASWDKLQEIGYKLAILVGDRDAAIVTFPDGNLVTPTKIPARVKKH